MKILYTIISVEFGGADTLVIDMINHLAKNKNDSIYFCVINEKCEEFLLKQIDPSVKILLLKRKPGGKKLKYLIEYINFIRKNKIELIHNQCIQCVKFSMFSKILSWKLNMVYTVHDTNICKNFKFSEVLINKVFINKFIAISDIVKEEILAIGIKPNKVEKIYNAINTRKFRSELYPELESDKTFIKIGNVARLVPEKKGQDLLIKAIALLKTSYPNLLCYFAGDIELGNEGFLVELKDLVKLNNLENNVIFLGNIENIPKFLASLDIFVLPSRYEGFGIALIEAMAMGLPCIASCIDGPKEIIKNDDYGLLFKNDDYEDLAKKLEYMINNLAVFNASKIEQYIEENFNIENMMEKVYRLYSS